MRDAAHMRVGAGTSRREAHALPSVWDTQARRAFRRSEVGESATKHEARRLKSW
jgi:hypothetical protein